MSAVHCNEFWFDADLFAIDWAANSVTQLDDPGIFCKIWFNELRDKNAIVTTCFDIAQTFLVLDRSFIDLCVPECDAHICSLWLSIGEDNCIVEV